MWKKLKNIDSEIIKYLTLITQLGLTVIISILVLFLIFLYLDRKLHTNGILMVIGIVVGVLTGILSAYQMLKKFYRRNE